MSNKAMKIFGDMFLKTIVILLGIVIIAFAVFFVVQVIKGGSTNNLSGSTEQPLDDEQLQAQLDKENATDDGNPGGESQAADEMPAEDGEAGAEPASSKELKIAVLNATGVKGLAGAWVDKLKGLGYTKVYAGNYQIGKLEATSIMVASDGMGQDLVSEFSAASIETGKLKDGFNLTDTSVSTDDIDIFIIIGAADNIMQ